MTENQSSLLCLDWNNPELALRSRNIQNIDIFYLPCKDLHILLGKAGGDFKEKECGAVPEGPFSKFTYYRDRYDSYKKLNSDWEIVIYFSDATFDPDNYNEKSIKRESKLTFL